MQTALTRNQVIASAAGTLGVLEALGNAGGRSSLRELVAAMRRPKATVHRMVSTLVNTGFVEQDPGSGDYALTLKAWRIGAAALRNLDFVEPARPILAALAAATAETVHLAVLDPSGGVVYIAKVESPQSIGVQTRLGQVNPAWCTATGRSLLAFHDAIAARVLAGRLERRTAKTVTGVRALRERLAEVRARGYAVTIAENSGVVDSKSGQSSAPGVLRSSHRRRSPKCRPSSHSSIPRSRWSPGPDPTAVRLSPA